MTRKKNSTQIITAAQPVNIHSAAVHIENKISLKQRQAWFYLLYHAFPYLDTQDIFHIKLSELVKAINYKNTNHQHLREMLRGLRVPVSWNVFDKDGNEVWGDGVLLADCEITPHTGICKYSFSPQFKKRFLNPQMYVKINLLISKKFNSKHSLNIYCLALDYLHNKFNYGEKIFSVVALRRYLGLEDHEYRLVGHLHHRILKQAEKDINADTDMKLAIIPLKKGKQIGAFKFCMSIKEEYTSFYNPAKLLSASSRETKQSEYTDIKNTAVQDASIRIENEAVQRFLVEHAISFCGRKVQENLKMLKDQLPGSNLENYLLYLIDYTTQEVQKGKIQNIAGFFVDLLQNDRQLVNYCFKVEESERNRIVQEQKAQEAAEKDLQDRYSLYTQQEFKAYLEVHYDSKQDLFANIFNKEIQPILRNVALKRNGGKIDRGLLGNPIIVGTLMAKADRFGYVPVSFDEWKRMLMNEPETKMKC